MNRATSTLAAALGLLVLLGAPAPALADAALDAVVRDFDSVEAGLKAMAPGDRAAGSALIGKNNAAVKKLGQIQDRNEAWKAQYDRARDLDKRIRARLAEPPPPDDKLLAARAKLDEVEKALPDLQPGDVDAANTLIAKINAAVDDLKASKARGAPVWKTEADRSRDYDRKARGLAAAPRPKSPPAGGTTGGSTDAPKPGGSAATPATPTAPVDPSAPVPELVFNDKRMLTAFDRDYKRMHSAMVSMPATDFQLKKNSDWAVSRIGRLEGTLGKIAAQGHPEVAKRRQQVEELKALYESKRAEAFSALSKDDAYQLSLFRKRFAADEAQLAGHQGTVLRRGGGGHQFAQPINAQRSYLAKMQNKEHDEIKKAHADHDAFVKAVEARIAESTQKAEALGDVRARLDETIAAFGRGSGYPPALPRDPEEAAIREFAKAAKGWKTKVDESSAYLRDVQKWSPEYQDVEYGNKLRRWFSEVPHQLPRSVEGVTGYFESRAAPGLMATIAAVSKSDLRRAAWADSKPTAVTRLEDAATALEGWKAFQVAMNGSSDPALDAKLEHVKAERAKWEGAVAAQLASERCYTQEGDFDAALLEVAKRTIKQKFVRIEPYHGKKSRAYEKREGDTIYKYDYDFFSVHTVAVDPSTGHHFVYLYVLTYYRLGYSYEKGKWLVGETHKLHRILPENVDK